MEVKKIKDSSYVVEAITNQNNNRYSPSTSASSVTSTYLQSSEFTKTGN